MILDPSLKIRMEQAFDLEDGMRHDECAEKILAKYDALKKKLNKVAEVVTCVNCPENEECPYAFDGYNTNGDCLAEK